MKSGLGDRNNFNLYDNMQKTFLAVSMKSGLGDRNNLIVGAKQKRVLTSQ